MMRSTLEWLMSRSCQRATFSSADERVAAQHACAARSCVRSVMGLRLCGMALEPFWPLPKDSSASSTSVRCRWRNSTAELLDAGADEGQARQELGVPVALHDLGRDRLVADAELGTDKLLDARVDVCCRCRPRR